MPETITTLLKKPLFQNSNIALSNTCVKGYKATNDCQNKHTTQNKIKDIGNR